MPTYAYACKQCGHRFDAVQSFADPALTECPECGGPLRKEYGSIGVTFNGSGFYRTDSRAGEKKGTDAAAPATSTSSASSTGGASTPSTSSKSEAKSSPASSGS
ncbi:FmdB family transcriptional regulator [Microbacterium sp. CFH 31415]|uniref:FmdB family zinc ribbon protein n=1 Tax=Microbacterium sp. CFH 31415 TaxID=2921732 RepID=UPI001F13049F|nr:FmdB family zinc ribbon protein [Microbacterium sp. CFH 31415]MCH6230187.1 FmdB family transcriptional regulator [Microbacterium sp. CFH 31415]